MNPAYCEMLELVCAHLRMKVLAAENFHYIESLRTGNRLKGNRYAVTPM